MKKILVLYSTYVPCAYVVNKALIKAGAEVHVVRWDAEIIFLKKNFKHSVYTPQETKGLSLYNRSDFKNVNELYGLVEKLNPQIILVSGTMDKLYLKVCSRIRQKTNIPVVCNTDEQYNGTIKNWVKIILSPVSQKRWFDYMFVPSYWQYEMALKYGYKRDKILLYNLCADVELFARTDIEKKVKSYPKNFLFIGRYSPEKGLTQLKAAWRQIKDKKGWTLTLVGDGPLKPELENQPDILCLNHLSQEGLLDLVQESGCFVLPSLSDPHPLVLHEAVAAGLPIVCSNVCGSILHFVLSSYNGYIFSHNKANDLKCKMEKIINLSDEELIEFSRNSRKLSTRITPEITAKTILSILEN